MDLQQISEIQEKIDDLMNELYSIKEARINEEELSGDLVGRYDAKATLLEIALSESRSDINSLPRKLSKKEIVKGGISEILKNVSNQTGIPAEAIVFKTRKREIVEVRQIVHTICTKYLNYSLAVIGYEIGRKDHATVLHSAKTINNLIDTDKIFCDKHSNLIHMYSLD